MSGKKRIPLVQMDMFEETMDKKMERMTKWMRNLERQIFVCSEEIKLMQQAVHFSKLAQNQKETARNVIEQLKMFGT